MNGYINGFSLNGAAYPSWVVRAVVVAVAAASVTVAPTRITFASAYGDAAVSVSLTQTHMIQGRATGTANVSASIAPRLIYAGASTALATATGNGAVRRDVFATAGGDATCTGEALTAQALGEASAISAATVVLANAHIIFPGRSVVVCEAVGTGTGDVTRYPTVVAGLGSVGYTRGEASVQRDGNTHFDHDGFVPGATAGAVADIPADRVKIIATFGSFDYADSTGTARSFIIFSGRSLSTGVNTASQAVATHIHRPTATVQATATATAYGTRIVLPGAVGASAATAYPARALIKHAAGAAGSVDSIASAGVVRTTFGQLSGSAVALAQNAQYGRQYLAGASAVGEAAGNGLPAQKHASAATGGASVGVVQADATLVQMGHVDAVIATALIGRAYALANSEIPAPDERYMIVPVEQRGMIVYFEDRKMVVT